MAIAEAVVRIQGSAGHNPLLEDFAVLLDIKSLHFAGLGVSLWVVYGLLVPLDVFKAISAESAVIAFASGFAVDSLAEPALKQFERKAYSKVATVQQAVGA
ncbi:MAG: hypothetical protein Q8P22_06540 [Chloroflexota bacterium]|nr:hypothetical protein [Chloroflexota bacterium]